MKINRFISGIIRLRIIAPLLAAAVLFGFMQDDGPLKNILQKLEKFRTDYPQEKIHLHMDKPYYAIGDTIWFKAYLVNAERNQLSNFSGIVYAELINDKDSVKQSLRLPMVAGLSNGDFALQDTLREGNYRIRAYTNWMRNFGEEYFFDKTIRIGNSVSNEILTSVSYRFAKTGSTENVSATINYSTLDGKPVANREVAYQVLLDFREVAKGKGTTNAKGQLDIKFNNTQPFILKSGKLITNLRLDEKRTATKVFPVKATSADVAVQFFPEGGNLVYGLRSKVGFKAVGADGLGLDVSGTIIDKNNTKIAELKSAHAGMGVFAITPAEGEEYTARIRFADGTENEYKLPQVQKQGYVLSINNQNADSLFVKITATKSIADQGAEISVVAQSSGVVHYVSKAKLTDGVASAAISKKRFRTGITQFTLFAADNQPVAERLAFINNQDQLDITVSSAKASYKKREKVSLAIDVKSPQGKPVIGSFSVAVTDETKVPVQEERETTILSNLLFSSDLPGYIEQPNYYFVNYNEQKARQLDNLMLTQGWRRFVWKNILNNAYPSLAFKQEAGLEVSGRVTATNGKPVAGGKVTLFSSAGDVFLIDTLTNAEGRFAFKNLYFNANTRFVIQARSEKGRKNVQIELDGVPPQLVTKNKNAPEVEVNVNQSIASYLKNSRNQFDELRRYGLARRSILLEEVRVVEKKPLAKNSSNLNGAGNADAVIMSDKLQNCLDLTQCLQGRVAGLVIQNGIAYSTRSMYSSFYGRVPMQLVIDGIYVEPTFLTSINPNDVESVEVLRSAGNTAIYGIRGGGGVLIITTKRGGRNENYASYAAGILDFNPQGFYKGRQFYSPDYDDPKTNKEIRDLRSTIYWNPNVVTTAAGKADMEFYNADGTGNYRVVIEGIDAEGNLGREVYRYRVE